jgi:hypothetical protein
MQVRVVRVRLGMNDDANKNRTVNRQKFSAWGPKGAARAEISPDADRWRDRHGRFPLWLTTVDLTSARRSVVACDRALFTSDFDQVER